jgi:hypothetical protein
VGEARDDLKRVWVPVSPGELCDRLTILELKVVRMTSPERREAAAKLLSDHARAWEEAGLPPRSSLPEDLGLREVNAALWDVEDTLRTHERQGLFDDTFVRLARGVYTLNDERARLKAALDARLGAGGTEPKEHA